jgi:hypothetical protein
MSDERKYETVRDKITDEEFAKFSAELAAAEKELEAARAERKTAVSEIAGRMNAASKRIAELADIVHTRHKTVEVEVVRIVEKGADFAKILRMDTNDVLRMEPLTWLEKQENLGFEG